MSEKNLENIIENKDEFLKKLDEAKAKNEEIPFKFRPTFDESNVADGTYVIKYKNMALTCDSGTGHPIEKRPIRPAVSSPPLLSPPSPRSNS